MKIKNSAERMGTDPIVPLLFRLSIPSIIAMAIQALYNVVDSIYVGRLSTDALSALSLTFPLQIIIIGIAVGTGIGTSSYISRMLGRGNKKMAANAAEHVMVISLIYGLIVAITGIFSAHSLLKLFTDNSLLTRMGGDYIQVIFIGSVALFFPMICNNILRGEGNTMAPMIAMLIGSIINIILDPFFIFGLWFFPSWGVKGAAYATVLSRAISGVFLAFMLFSDKNEIKINFRDFSFDFSILTDIYKVGFPAMVMQFLASFMLGGMNRILASFDTTAIAAAGIYFRLQSFVFMPVFGLNQGYMPIIGYNYGHNNPSRMKKTIKSAFIIAAGFTAAGFLLFQLIPGTLITMFNNDPELIKIGSRALQIISLAFPIIGPAIIIAATFQALGKGMPSLLLSFLRQIIILLPLMYILGRTMGLNNLWYAFPISEIFSFILGFFWLKKVLSDTLYTMQKNQRPNPVQK